jgi:hypothetical protein
MPPENSEQGQWFATHLLLHEDMLRAWLRSRFPTGIDAYLLLPVFSCSVRGVKYQAGNAYAVE